MSDSMTQNVFLEKCAYETQRILIQTINVKALNLNDQTLMLDSIFQIESMFKMFY